MLGFFRKAHPAPRYAPTSAILLFKGDYVRVATGTPGIDLYGVIAKRLYNPDRIVVVGKEGERIAVGAGVAELVLTAEELRERRG